MHRNEEVEERRIKAVHPLVHRGCGV